MTFLMNQISQLIQLAKKKSEEEPYNEITQWVATDSTQYIDTGFIADQNSKIEIGFQVLDTGTSAKAVFGSRKWNGSVVSQAFYLYKTNSAIVQVGWGSQSKNIALDNATELQAPIRLIIDKGSVTLVTNAKTYIETFTETTFETSTSVVIGTSRTGTSGTELDNRPATVDVRYCKLWNNGTPAYNYYPALDDKIQPCLYDKVTKTFAYAKKISDGTTTYDLGFKRWNKFDVDYIESSGTQYINTGYAFADDFAYEVEYEGLNNGECLLGGRTSSVRTAIIYRAMATQVDGQTTVPIAGLNVTQTPFKLGVLSNTKHKIKVAIANNKGNIWVDDTQVYTNESFTGTYISGKTTAIFADHFGDLTGTSEYQEYATSKLYALKFWQGTTLVRSYKPVVWHNGDTTAVACLYDEVYNKMYTNAGTGSFKAYIVGADDTVYEVGMYLKTIKTSTVATVGPIIELGEYPQDGMGYHIKTTTDSNSSNYLFGSRKTTDGNLQIATLSGSQTGGTILSIVMGESITWKSGITTWTRSTSGTTYECSMQTYKDGNTYKFNIIGYNYTLDKEANRQTATYTNPIDERQDIPMLYFGAFHTENILFGTNYHYFVEWNLPNVRHTLLPVIDTTHTKICFIDNKTKEIYEFTKVGSYTPTTNNITFKQLDGTIITGTL